MVLFLLDLLHTVMGKGLDNTKFGCILFADDVLTKTSESSDDISALLTHGTSSTKGCVSILENPQVGEHRQHDVFVNGNMCWLFINFVYLCTNKKGKNLG